MIREVENRFKSKKKVSSRLQTTEFGILRTNVPRILKDNLGYHAYKVRIVSLLKDKLRTKRKTFSN